MESKIHITRSELSTLASHLQEMKVLFFNKRRNFSERQKLKFTEHFNAIHIMLTGLATRNFPRKEE